METRRTTGTVAPRVPRDGGAGLPVQKTEAQQTPALTPTPTTKTTTPTTKPTTLPTQAEQTFANDGATTRAQAASVPTSSGGPIKKGVLGFLLQKNDPILETGPAILSRGDLSPSVRKLLELRVDCPPMFSPHVELVKKDGTAVVGAVKGVDDAGRVIVDAGRGRTHLLKPDEELSLVRHQMDTDGDLHTALVTVFNAHATVVDPWSLPGFLNKTLTIETFDKEHGSFAVAAKKGDVSGRDHVVVGSDAEGLQLKGGGHLLKEHWDIARITLEQPAYSYKKDGTRLSELDDVLSVGTPLEVVLPGGKSIKGEFLGVAKDSEGSDYVVLREQNGLRQALRDVVDVKAEARTVPLWQHADYSSVYR